MRTSQTAEGTGSTGMESPAGHPVDGVPLLGCGLVLGGWSEGCMQTVASAMFCTTAPMWALHPA